MGAGDRLLRRRGLHGVELLVERELLGQSGAQIIVIIRYEDLANLHHERSLVSGRGYAYKPAYEDAPVREDGSWLTVLNSATPRKGMRDRDSKYGGWQEAPWRTHQADRGDP